MGGREPSYPIEDQKFDSQRLTATIWGVAKNCDYSLVKIFGLSDCGLALSQFDLVFFLRFGVRETGKREGQDVSFHSLTPILFPVSMFNKISLLLILHLKIPILSNSCKPHKP
jgi:hypothetical protein